MKFRKTVFLVPFILLLCACTVQTDFDIYDFCSRYNRLKNEKILPSESFYSDKNGFYHCPVCVGESILLVSVGIKENQSVQSLCVTVEKGSFSSENTQAVFDEIRLIFSAFFYGDKKMADEALASVSFDETDRCVFPAAAGGGAPPRLGIKKVAVEGGNVFPPPS